MADSNPSVLSPTYLGALNGDVSSYGDSEVGFLTVYGGEVLAQIAEKNVFMNRITMRPMPRGASNVRFEAVGEARTMFSEVGKSVLLDTPQTANLTPSTPSDASGIGFLSANNVGWRDIYIDDPLTVGNFVDNWEQFKSTFEARGPLKKKQAEALARDFDKYIARLIVKAAVGAGTTGFIDYSASNFPEEFVQVPADSSRGTPGAPIEDDDTDGTNAGLMNFIDSLAATDGSALLDQIRRVMQQFDENRVPEDGRYVALKPAQYNLLVQNQDLLNRDFGGQNGIFSDGTVFRAWGAELIKTLHIPTTDLSSGGTVGIRGTNYNVNASSTVAVAWHRDGIGGVEAGVSPSMDDKTAEYNGTLLVVRAAKGFDVRHPLYVARIGTA